MRVLLLFAAMLIAAACVSDSAAPVPESGTYQLELVRVDADRFLRIDKAGARQAVQLVSAVHPDRAAWTGEDWQWFAGELFPGDRIGFEALRMLRGGNLVPASLVSPGPAGADVCLVKGAVSYAKTERHLVARRDAPGADVLLQTSCTLHDGLAPHHQDSLFLADNDARLPTRSETLVDLDGDETSEQRHVRLAHVSRSEILRFVRTEAGLSRNELRQLTQALERL